MTREEKAWRLGQAFGRNHRLADVSTEDMYQAAVDAGVEDWFDVFKYGAQDIWKRSGREVGLPSFGHGLKPNPKAGVTYLAVMPLESRQRKLRPPKSVAKREVGYYQKHAKYFFEAPGMTAAEARMAIADGHLIPTWVDGQPVVGYSAETGEPRFESRTSLPDMMDMAEARGGLSSVIRIGRTIYQPHWTFRGPRRVSWHKTGISGFTYEPNEMSYGDLERHLRNHDTFELAFIAEDYDGVPMGGFVALAKGGYGLGMINNDKVRHQSMMLEGRRFRTTEVVDGGLLRAADLEWL